MSPPPFAIRALLALYRKLHALADAIVPAEIALVDLACGLEKTQILHAVAHLRIPDAIAEGSKDAAQLAAETSTNADALHRVLRAAAAMGVLELRRDGKFRNNRLSDALRTREVRSVRNFVESTGFASHVHAYADIVETVRSGESAFERVHGMSPWTWFAEHPEEGKVFADGMAQSTMADGDLISAGYDFGKLRRVCDVAGGRGPLIAAILERYPTVHGVLFDRPHVLEMASELLRARGLHSRVDRIPGDFFESVPPGCDGYLLKDICDDWDDARTVQILKNIRRAMSATSRLFVIEVLVDRNVPDYFGSLIDVEMMIVTQGGRQRSREDFRALFEASDLSLERVVPLASPNSIVIGTPT